MITQKHKERVAFTMEPSTFANDLLEAQNAWFALGNSVPFKVTLLFEGTIPARGWISAMREDDK